MWSKRRRGTSNSGRGLGADAVDGLRDVDVDVVALQELGPDHAAAIAASPNLLGRFPAQELHPEPGVLGIGLLSRGPILRAEHTTDPSLIEAVVDIAGRPVTVITAHPLPGRISMAGPLPVAFDASERDRALQAIRARVDAAIGRGESVVVLGDFNVAPDEPGYRDLVAGLHDAHAEVGQGPGWTWRPSRFEGTGIGLLRIDLALSGPNLPPVAAREHCGLPGDHCQFEAWFSLAGASLGQQSFQLLLPGHDPIKALPVSILDTTGLVVDANAAIEPFANPDGAHPVPGSPERMRINWLGGACDRDVRARVTRSGSDLLVTIDTFVPGDGGCTLEGISRTFELQFVRAFDPARIRVVAS